jgi:hypothetical protein
MARKALQYYRVEFDVRQMKEPREQESEPIFTKEVKVILAESSDIKRYADVHAEALSLFPGQYTFTGRSEPAEDYNDIIMNRTIKEDGLLSKLFRVCFG